jgi:hypothetical protein
MPRGFGPVRIFVVPAKVTFRQTPMPFSPPFSGGSLLGRESAVTVGQTSEMQMPSLFGCTRTFARVAATTALLCSLLLPVGFEPAAAAPGFVSDPASGASVLQQAQIFRRGRPPIYPYYYSPGWPGGYSFYFGFVPYEKGDYETQAIQRAFPQLNYPRSMRYWTPQSGF